jgi:hypothetical protein
MRENELTDGIWTKVFVQRDENLSVQRKGEIKDPPFCKGDTVVSAAS